MKKMIAVATACIATLVSAAAFAAAPEAVSAPKTAQQTRMTTCNADAAGKKGDERKAFMKECLSNKPAAAAPMTQQEKMKSCNADAAGKKGDERKAFMKSCLSSGK
ncbi:phosphate starvation-inducible protein PsiF [Duganella sp. LX20W]|uniref:Phosphate starvation-inducible protein PsiF n=1 Tax=Rugamonas brunnea TaxID=2758569 RepID=A0A7W2IA15_9BURK|nr:PsiF family protein [Rugamonas brunnea]MBA5635685.1 phosphate starvation-inducible protein PsiF [Rugamonas brunnea]